MVMGRLVGRAVVVAAVACAVSSAALLGAGGDGQRDPPRYAFVTSVFGTGDLSSWADAGGFTGLAAGDAVCQARAAAAGLANPGGFVAWLSDSGADAYCRVHGLPGTKAGNCGQATLPASAGPWLRLDGFPFADRVDRATSGDGRILAPVRYDDLGGPTWSPYFTATSPDGTLLVPRFYLPCADWQSDIGPEIVAAGSPEQTTVDWTSAGPADCGMFFTLLCMEAGAGAPLPHHQSGGAQAFVTTATGTADLGSWPDAAGEVGVAAGDAICRARAAAAHLSAPESFRAWLSDSVAGVGAVDRLAYDGPWVRLDGVRVASSKTDLCDGELFAPISVTEEGTYVDHFSVWSGTVQAGAASGDDCHGWTTSSVGVSGGYGTANTVSPYWTDDSAAGCEASSMHLYCLSEVAAVLFTDDLESAATDGWSTASP